MIQVVCTRKCLLKFEDLPLLELKIYYMLLFSLECMITLNTTNP